MTQAAYPIIRQYDPSATIVHYGRAKPYSGNDPNLSLDMDFANQTASMNITQYGDAISVHAYPWTDGQRLSKFGISILSHLTTITNSLIICQYG